MDAIRIPSIRITKIDVEKCYFNPGCAMNVYKPKAGLKITNMLNQYYGSVKYHDLCCHHDPRLSFGSTIINNCAGCDRRFRSQYEGIQTISLWEVLDGIKNLPLPNHKGLTVSIHDSCSFRPKPQVHAAVRSLLRKMNIEIVDSQYSGTNSICCGDNFIHGFQLNKLRNCRRNGLLRCPVKTSLFIVFPALNPWRLGEKRHTIW